MVGNVEIIRDGYRDIQQLQYRAGSFLKTFLNTCSCKGVCRKGSCSLEQYDDCPEVEKEGNQKLRFRDDGTHTIRLSEFRSQLYANLLQQLIQYFDPNILEAFEIFNPKFLKGRCQLSDQDSNAQAGLEKYYMKFESIVPNAPITLVAERLKAICKFYHLGNSEVIATSWESFLEVLTKDATAMKVRDTDSATFWSTVISREDIQISSVVRDLIVRVLTTSFTSADAERAFSMVSNIKTPDRSSLSPASLENLVRIAFNGPETLSENNVFEYTKEFVKVSSRVDDPSTVGGRPAKPEAFKSFFSKSRIF